MGKSQSQIKMVPEFDLNQKYYFKNPDSYINCIEKEEGYPVEVHICIEFINFKSIFEESSYLKGIAFYKSDTKLELKSDTEFVQIGSNILFSKPLIIPYIFETKNEVQIQINNYTKNITGNNFKLLSTLFELNISMSQLVRNKGINKYPLMKRNTNSEIGMVSFQSQSSNFNTRQKVILFNPLIEMKSFYRNLFFVISIYEKGKLDKSSYVYKSEVKEGINTFEFDQVELFIKDVYEDDQDKEKIIQCDVFEYLKGSHNVIGSTQFTALKIHEQNSSKLILENKIVGKATFNKFKTYTQYYFAEFLNSGLEFQVFVAIDFTKSNLSPSHQDSLHSFNLSKNQYFQTMKSVLTILLQYDSNKKIPFLGFGAKIPPYITSRASNCFACNGNIFDPEVCGLEGIISEYFNILKKIIFHGPTNFSDLLKFCKNAIIYEMKNSIQFIQ